MTEKVWTLYQFLNCVDRPRKTRVMINIYAMFGFLPDYYCCLYVLREETVKTAFYKENARKHSPPVSKNKTKKTPPFPIGGKMYHVDQSKNDMATWHLVV